MVKTLDTGTLAAIRDPDIVVPRNFLLITARDGEGEPVNFGFTDYGEDVSLNIVDGLTLEAVNHNFYGDERPIISVPPVPMKIGLEVDTTAVVLNPFHPVVAEMYRGYDLRNAPAQLHRGYLDPETMLLAAAPRCRRLGFVNAAPERIGGAGAESELVIEIVSVTRELTRTNPAKRSDETQRRRSGDRARRYSDTAHLWPVWWGEAKGTPDVDKRSRRR